MLHFVMHLAKVSFELLSYCKLLLCCCVVVLNTYAGYISASIFIVFSLYAGMDTESFDGGHMESLIPKRRSLKSWLELSEGVRNHLATKVTIQGLDDRHMMMPIAYEHETASQCINVH